MSRQSFVVLTIAMTVSSWVYAQDRSPEMRRPSFIVLTIAMAASTWVYALDTGCLLDVVFVLDSSGSIRDNNVPGEMDNWGLLLDFIEDIIEKLNVGPTLSHVAAVMFANDAQLVFDFNPYQTPEEVMDAVDHMRYMGGNTNTTGGLRETKLNVLSAKGGRRPEVPGLIILITDGYPTRETDMLIPTADEIKALGVTIIAIGVTQLVNETWMKQIVSQPIEDNWIPVANYDKLGDTLIETTRASCNVAPKPIPTTTTTTPTTTTTTPTTTTTTPTTTTTTPTTTTTTPTTTTTTPTTTTTTPTTTTTTPTTTTTTPTTTTTTPTTTTTTPKTTTPISATLTPSINTLFSLPDNLVTHVRALVYDILKFSTVNLTASAITAPTTTITTSNTTTSTPLTSKCCVLPESLVPDIMASVIDILELPTVNLATKTTTAPITSITTPTTLNTASATTITTTPLTSTSFFLPENVRSHILGLVFNIMGLHTVDYNISTTTTASTANTMPTTMPITTTPTPITATTASATTAATHSTTKSIPKTTASFTTTASTPASAVTTATTITSNPRKSKASATTYTATLTTPSFVLTPEKLVSEKLTTIAKNPSTTATMISITTQITIPTHPTTLNPGEMIFAANDIITSSTRIPKTKTNNLINTATKPTATVNKPTVTTFVLIPEKLVSENTKPTNKSTTRSIKNSTTEPNIEPNTEYNINPDKIIFGAHPTISSNNEPSTKPNAEPNTKSNPGPSTKLNTEPNTKSNAPAKENSMLTAEPNNSPTIKSATEPNTRPTTKPINEPNNNPTTKPIDEPSNNRTPNPNNEPSNNPTPNPNNEPSNKPNTKSNNEPSNEPIIKPNNEPSTKPPTKLTTAPNTELTTTSATKSTTMATTTPTTLMSTTLLTTETTPTMAIFTTPTTIISKTTPAVIDTTPCGGDVIIVLQCPGNFEGPDLGIIKSLILELLDEVGIDEDMIRLGLLTFGDSFQPRFHRTRRHKRDEFQAAFSVSPCTTDSVNSADVIRYIRNYAPNRAILLRSSKSMDVKETLHEAELAKKAGIQLMPIGIGSWKDKHELKAMSSYPYSNNLLTVNGLPDLTNHKPQFRNMICGTSACDVIVDIAFLLDASESIGDANFAKEVEFVTDVAGGFHSTSQVILLPFSDCVSAPFRLYDFQDQRSPLGASPPCNTGGSRDTAAALAALRTSIFTEAGGDRVAYPNVAVLLTDGASVDQMATLNEALQLRALGISLFVVGVGSSLDAEEMIGIVGSPSSNNVFLANDFDSLSAARENLNQALCHNVEDCKPNSCTNAGTCVDLFGGFQCNCASGFSGNNCEKGCSGALDIALILDISGNDEYYYELLLKFVTQLLYGLPIDAELTRVGIITYADNSIVNDFSYSTMQQIENALAFSLEGGKTNPKGDVELAFDNVFVGKLGERKDASKIVIVLTDGNSDMQPESALPETDNLRGLGTQFYVVAIGPDINANEINRLATTDDASHVIYVTSSASVLDGASTLLSWIC